MRLEDHEYSRKKYDYDAFNAEAVAKYHTWPDNIFLAHFEKTRQKAVVDLKSIYKDSYENHRMQNWIDGVFISHAREHLVALSRFLTLDTLENEWSTYIQRFDKLENKDEFLQKQGFKKIEDILVHIVGWWDEGTRLIKSAQANPDFVYEEPNTDQFNAELLITHKNTSPADVRRLFESKRIVASAKLDKFLDNLPPEYEVGQEVDLIIASKTDIGYKAIINNLHWGILYKNEVQRDIQKAFFLPKYRASAHLNQYVGVVVRKFELPVERKFNSDQRDIEAGSKYPKV